MRLRAGRILLRENVEVRSGNTRVSWASGLGMVAIRRDGPVLVTYRRRRSSACALALVPASHQLLTPAVNVSGISLAGGSALSGAVRDGAAVWVAVAAAVADMKKFLRIIVGRVIIVG